MHHGFFSFFVCPKRVLHLLVSPYKIGTDMYEKRVTAGKEFMNHMKKGLLAVSFGTSVNETREKTIDAIERELAAACPDCQLYRAWTSRMIIRKLKQRDQVQIDTVKEAFARMLADGITEVMVQPTHVIKGIENEQMMEEIRSFSEHFEKISVGEPLLSSEEDFRKVIEAVMEEQEDLEEQEALVFMGHGTEHHVNPVYAALDYMFKDLGYENVHVGTVEAHPSFASVLRLVKASDVKKVRLAPFMVVAGDHAMNDMAGGEEDSWKSLLEAEGYEVTCVLKGLGEYKGIQKLYAEHARQAELLEP